MFTDVRKKTWHAVKEKISVYFPSHINIFLYFNLPEEVKDFSLTKKYSICCTFPHLVYYGMGNKYYINVVT